MNIQAIELAMGFKLTEAQIKYITEPNYIYDKSVRQSGFTTAFIIKIIITGTSAIRYYDLRHTDIYVDEIYDTHYHSWYIKEFMRIYNKLKDGGIKVRDMDYYSLSANGDPKPIIVEFILTESVFSSKISKVVRLKDVLSYFTQTLKDSDTVKKTIKENILKQINSMDGDIRDYFLKKEKFEQTVNEAQSYYKFVTDKQIVRSHWRNREGNVCKTLSDIEYLCDKKSLYYVLAEDAKSVKLYDEHCSLKDRYTLEIDDMYTVTARIVPINPSMKIQIMYNKIL